MLNARKAWEDLCFAASMLEDEEDPDRFRILWVACITLVRAIGHVLDKNDGPEVKRIANELYATWRDPQNPEFIFEDFINKDRNLLLKEYSFNYMAEGLFLVADDMVVSSVDGDLYKPVEIGKYAGQDCRDVLNEAIAWWDKQLGIIEERVNTQS